MAKYHINGEGNPGLCSAAVGNCPFGGEANHYSSQANARKAFELSMASKELTKTTRKRLSSKDAIAAAEQRRSLREFATISRGGWEAPIQKPSPREKATHDILTSLAESTTVGNMFERASKLKKDYGKWFNSNFEADVLEPEELSRDNYLHLVAPATSAAVMEVESTLEDLDWTTRQNDDEIDSNRRTFSEIMVLDMSTDEGPKKAVEILKSSGWGIEDDSAAEDLRTAVLKGQEKALSYGARYKYEQLHLL